MNWTLFHWAAHKGLMGLVLYCLNNGLSFYELDLCGDSPLTIAIKEGHEEVVKLFI